MNKTRSITLILLLILFCKSPVASFAETHSRYALVIGNSDYKKSPLKNPVNDSQDMAKVLSESGFEVDLLVNASQRQMEKSIQNLGVKLRNGGVGLFYFAGHGVQVNNLNYLIPIDANIKTEADVKYEAVEANRVMSQMEEAGNDVNLVFLDACRDNPYTRSFRRSAQQGLAPMDSPVGSLVAFATAPGKTALDGDGRNGVYTKHLIKAIRESGLEIGRMMRSVRTQVREETEGEQVPFELSSLEGDFYFHSINFQIDKTTTNNALEQNSEKANNTKRGWLGLSMKNLNKSISQTLGFKSTKGVLVVDIIHNSPAYNKLEIDDIIIAIDDTPLENVHDLRKFMFTSKSGSKVNIDIFRNRIFTQIQVFLGSQPR